MKPLLLATVVACLGIMSCSDTGGGGASSGTMKNETDSVSYAIGMNIGKSLQRDSIQVDPDLIAAGAKDAIAGKTAFTDTVMQNVLTSFQQKMMAKFQEKMMKQQDSMNKAGEANKKKGDDFLAQNKAKAGVQTTASGLQYEVLKEGTGPMPKATDNVKVHYKGTLIDGTEFDASKGDPATFNVSGVIPGWTEALKMMKVGSKWRIYVPSDLAYGNNPPPGGKIGPGSVLIFEMELVEIAKGDAPGGAPSGAPSGAPGSGGGQ